MEPTLYSTHPLARNANQEHKENLSKIESVCASIVEGISSPMTLISATIFQILWIIIGQMTHLDPFPFAFLLTISNVLQLILIFIVAVGQRLSSHHAEARASADHESISRILHHQDVQESMLLKIMDKLGIDASEDQEKVQRIGK